MRSSGSKGYEPSNALTYYDSARKALTECRRVDEVKNFKDKAEAIRTYAKRAKDRQLFMNAVEISARADAATHYACR